MAGPRIKRKRTETEVPPPPPRRPRRDQSGPEYISKNETISSANAGEATIDDAALEDHAKPAQAKSEKMKENSVKVTARLGQKASTDDGGNDHANPEENEVKNGPQHQSQSEQSAPIPRRSQKMVNEKSSGATIRGGPAAGEKTNSGGKQNREKRIRALISHRKLLLARLQQGKTAAQHRLDGLKEKDPARKAETGEEERLRFAALSREITSLARKQTKESNGSNGTAPIEKRTQLSLRRGSGVGKRMNAALSSLAPVHSIQQTTATGTAPTEAPGLAPSPLKTAPPVAGQFGNSQAIVSSGSGILQTPALKHTAAPIAFENSNPPSLQVPAPVPLVPPSATAGPAKKSSAPVLPLSVSSNGPINTGRGAGQKALNKQLSQYHGVPPTRAPTKQSPSKSSMQTNKGFPPPPNIAGTPVRGPVQPIVAVPEAMALRERRKAIKNQLLQLSEQLSTEQQRTGSNRIPELIRELAVKGASPPPGIPSRRRTHWDTVLEEMRWLATDFIEERKWKLNAACAVAHGVSCAVGNRLKIDALGAVTESDVETPDLGTTLESEYMITEEDALAKAEQYAADRRLADKNDEKKLREIARKSSSMVSALWSFSNSGSRFETARAADTSLTSPFGARSFTTPQDEDKHLPQNPTIPEKRHEQLDAISQSLEQVLEVLLAVRRGAMKPKSFGLDLLPDQTNAVSFMDETWMKCHVGCLFSGPVSSGKTFTACSILRKYKSSGPQLVVCTADSLVKWFDELTYFDGIHAVGASSEIITTRGVSSVVVCSFRDLSLMENEVASQFRTIVVDTRYPVGFRGSRPKVCIDSSESSSHSLLSTSAPKEVASTDWWENAVSLIMRSNARRILIDPFSAADRLTLFDGFSDRSLLEHLSLRAAFLFGQAVFPVSWNFSKTNLLGWGRRHIKRSHGSGSKLKRIRELFCSMLDAVSYNLLVSENQDRPAVEVVSCDMTALQRSTYVRCCNSVRAALSRQLEGVQKSSVHFAFRSIAESLMRLRRICTHADVRGILNSSLGQRQLLAYSFATLGKSSASEPDIELASLILAGSGKLCELSRILVTDGGIKMNEAIQQAVAIPQRDSSIRSSPPDNFKKVAILAVLPEVQFLVSLLLGALGICHEVLLLDDNTAGNRDANSSTWFMTQRVLSRFNCKIVESAPVVNVIVTSPITVAGNHGGLGIESADLVVLVDDDWSGRGELLMRSLLSRVSLGREPAEIKILRLVSRDSCEESFCPDDPDASIDPASEDHRMPWPVSAFGLIQPPKDLRSYEESIVHSNWKSMGYLKGIHRFPGKSLFAWSNKSLEDVLGHDTSSRPLFGAVSGTRFLPSASGTLEIGAQVCLIQSLSKIECNSSVFLFYLNAPVHLASIVPPFPDDFDHHFSLRNLGMLSIVQYMHRFGTEMEVARVELSDTLVLPRPHQSARLDEKANEVLVAVVENSADGSSQEALAGGVLSYDDNGFPSSSDSVHNVFASSFLLSSNSRSNEGSQGMELLVYFPPLFPNLLESFIIASESARSQKPILPSSKRTRCGGDQSSVKRLKLGDEYSKPISLTAEAPPLVTDDSASQNDAAAVLLDLTNDYGLAGIGAIPLPRDSALVASQSLCPTGPNNFSAMDDLMVGTQPKDHSDAEEMRTQTGSVLAGSNSVILFVSRKRQRGQIVHQHPIHGQQNVPWGTLSVSSNGLYGTNGADSGNKHKNKSVLDGPTAPPRDATPMEQLMRAPSAVFSSPANTSKSKDMRRSRIIAASRQLGQGATLFDAAPFRAASVRLRSKLGHRLSRLCWQSGTPYEAGPGLPLFVSKPQGRSQIFRNDFEADHSLWISVVKRLRNESAITGDEAIEVSRAQSSELHRSLSAPRRVDFGPFNSGFLYLPSGMTAISPPRPTVGVTLPMGVKLPPTAKDQLIPWTANEEVILKTTILRFGTNWTLASRALSGLQDVVTVTKQPPTTSRSSVVPRAAKTCKEQWQMLTRRDPALALELKKVERTQRERSILKFDEPKNPDIYHEIIGPTATDVTGSQGSTEDKPCILILVSSDEVPEKRTTANSQVNNGAGGRLSRVEGKRARSGVASARKRIQRGPGPILGTSDITAANNPHPSHMQSVQSSVASSWTSGRTEMWPLQFLDASDRFRASQVVPPQPQVPAPNTTTASSSSSSSRSPPAPSPSAMAPVAARTHSAPVPPVPAVRTSSTASGIPGALHHPTATASPLPPLPTNPSTNRSGVTSYPSPPSIPPPPVLGDNTNINNRAQSSMHVFIPPPSQSTTRSPTAVSRQGSSSVSNGGSTARNP